MAIAAAATHIQIVRPDGRRRPASPDATKYLMMKRGCEKSQAASSIFPNPNVEANLNKRLLNLLCKNVLALVVGPIGGGG